MKSWRSKVSEVLYEAFRKLDFGHFEVLSS